MCLTPRDEEPVAANAVDGKPLDVLGQAHMNLRVRRPVFP